MIWYLWFFGLAYAAAFSAYRLVRCEHGFLIPLPFLIALSAWFWVGPGSWRNHAANICAENPKLNGCAQILSDDNRRAFDDQAEKDKRNQAFIDAYLKQAKPQ